MPLKPGSLTGAPGARVSEADGINVSAVAEGGLTAAARDGSAEAFAELYRRHARGAQSTARYLLRDSDDADDIVSEAFAGVLTALRNGSGPTDDTFKAYLMACVRNGCTLRGRQKGRTVPVDPGDFAAEAGPLEDPQRFVDGDAITAAYSSLPAQWQQVLWLTAVEDRPLGEVADKMRLRKPAAAALSYRAHQALTEAYLTQSIAAGHLTGTDCELIAPQLARYVRSRCRTKRQQQQVHAHVTTCGRCTALAAELSQVNHSLRGLMIPPFALAAFLLDHSKAHGAAAAATAPGVESAAGTVTVLKAAAGRTAQHAGHVWVLPTKMLSVLALTVFAVGSEHVDNDPQAGRQAGTNRAAAAPAVDVGAPIDGNAADDGPAIPEDATVPAAPVTVGDAQPPLTAGDPGAGVDGTTDPVGSAQDTTGDLPVLDVAIPPVSLPDGDPELPELTIPQVVIPSLPTVTAPTVTIPTVTVPTVTVPTVTIRDVGIPAVTVPSNVTVPSTPAVTSGTTAAPTTTTGSPPVTTAPVGPAPTGAQIGLGAASSFSVLAGAAVTSTGPTVITGQVGVSGGPVTGLLPSQLLTASLVVSVARAVEAQDSLGVAIAAIDDMATVPLPAVELGGRTVLPGVYTSATVEVTGTVTLDGRGDPNAVFVFTTGTTLVTASASRVELINGADPCNVFWHVGSSATFGTFSSFAGTVIADVSITATTGARFDGRLLARSGAVTLDSDTVTLAAC